MNKKNEAKQTLPSLDEKQLAVVQGGADLGFYRKPIRRMADY